MSQVKTLKPFLLPIHVLVTVGGEERGRKKERGGGRRRKKRGGGKRRERKERGRKREGKRVREGE